MNLVSRNFFLTYKKACNPFGRVGGGAQRIARAVMNLGRVMRKFMTPPSAV